MYTTGELIRAWRDAAEMSQRELAARADTSRQIISRYENDETCPSVEALYRIALAVGVDLSTFLNGPSGVDGIEPPVLPRHKAGGEVGLPLFETIPSEGWTMAMLDAAETVTVTTSADVGREGVVALRINGEEMFPTLIRGDLALVDITRRGISSGEVGIWSSPDGPLIRRYVRRNRRKYLEADNATLPPIDVTGDDSRRLLGVVVGMYRGKP